jgi:hypothetical protein
MASFKNSRKAVSFYLKPDGSEIAHRLDKFLQTVSCLRTTALLPLSYSFDQQYIATNL